jgi:3-methyl-2-oxobutanoate hydroxymethyltransferase
MATGTGHPQTRTDDGHVEAVTLRDLRRWRREGVTFPCLTAYDATLAKWLARAGVPVLLVGDSAAEVVLGESGTIHAPLEFLITITAAVQRGAPHAFIMADMPFMSYQASKSAAIENAGRFMTEGRANAVKMEVDHTYAPLVERMARAGIPVVAHIGCKPQQVSREGGYKIAGKTAEARESIVRDATTLVEAGAVIVLVEATPADVAQAVVDAVEVPVIGCGAGPACHGQIVVTHDILGLTDWQPSFAKSEGRLGSSIQSIVEQWCEKVRRGELTHPY